LIFYNKSKVSIKEEILKGSRLEFLKKIREKKSWSRYEMAKQLDMKPIHKYYQYEKNTSKGMHLETLVKIWEVSGMSAKSFMEMLKDEFITK